MMYSKFRCKLLANDSSIFIWGLIAEYYGARGAQLVKAIRLLLRAVIWRILYLVIRNNSFTFTFTDYSSEAGYMVRQLTLHSSEVESSRKTNAILYSV